MSGLRRYSVWGCTLVAWLCAVSLCATSPASAATPDWLVVDYSDVIDRRQLSHSGESVGALLGRLDGRPLPPPGERPQDFHAHRVLEPLLEPYAFVLPDALDSLAAVHPAPWTDVGSLWQPGEPQPAWVELLRARRYLVESDGAGGFRAILPWFGGRVGAAGSETSSRAAAQSAWEGAWPVLRHVFAAEQRRLVRAGVERPALQVEVHAYRHYPERSEFRLGTEAEQVTLADLRGEGLRPTLDLERIRAFLSSGLRLEGARLESDGSLRLLGSRVDEPPRLLGRTLNLADLAVAFRAVFHGGLAEPYMSLDRGYTPTRSVVNYGGRLRDTALGLVSLRCDIRFKTFSLGIDIEEGRDLRERLRASLPGFGTHLERLAAHPDSRGMAGQQTRLWFYPDNVDLTLSEQGDVLVLRHVRMSAASERVGTTGEATQEEVRPWTRAAVDAINRDYDTLAGFFPEMADLDQVVRLLSLFAWLKSASAEGHLLPELETLLALELPALFTPRSYPQLLAFNALPPPGAADRVEVFDRVGVGEALDRLGAASGRPLPARRRYQRAVAALDPSRREHAALLARFERYDVERMNESQLDVLALQAERVRMHETVLATLEMPRRRELAQRLGAGEQLRMFSVGIGGLDLGMGPVVARARGRRVGLAAGGAGLASPSGDSSAPGAQGAPVGRREPREAWRRDPEGLPPTTLPDHGLGGMVADGPASREFGHHRVAVGREPSDKSGQPGTSWVLTIYGADSPNPRTRRLFLDRNARAARFERLEERRLLRYRFASEGERLAVRRVDDAGSPSAPAPAAVAALPAGLVLLEVGDPGSGAIESPGIELRLTSGAGGEARKLEAEFPRRLLQRLVLGREVDLTPTQPLPGLSPLPDALGAVASVMVSPGAERWRAPWDAGPVAVAGEEDPVRLARALGAWWAGAGEEAPAAIVGVEPGRSPARWEAAPRPGTAVPLFLPAEGFSGPMSDWRAVLAEAWGPAGVVDSLPDELQAPLVVLVSAEPPTTFAVRLRELARDERMRGRLLAAWCLAGPVREDLARALIDEGRLAGVGLVEDSLMARRRAVTTLRAMRNALSAAGNEQRVEHLPGPFLWHF
jgi:hypothetical protein